MEALKSGRRETTTRAKPSRPGRGPRISKAVDPTLADLVVLGLVSHRPMHGYELNQELQKDGAQEWACVSRAQIYYSIRKLLRKKWLEACDSGRSGGPERLKVQTTAAGRKAMQRTLRESWWAQQRERSPFATWFALSVMTGSSELSAGLRERRGFLRDQIARERETRKSLDSAGESAGALLCELAVRRLETELAWINEVEQAV